MKMRLAAFRTNKKITLDAAAERAEVSRKTVWNWENGVCDPPITKLLILCDMYGCTVDDIDWGN